MGYYTRLALSESGDVMVDAASINATGSFAHAIFARANVGDVRVTTGAIDVAGLSNPRGVEAQAFGGNVSVTIGGPLSVNAYEGGTGVDVFADGLAEIALGDASVSGVVSKAVFAVGGDVSIVLSGAIRSDATAQYTPFGVVSAYSRSDISPAA